MPKDIQCNDYLSCMQSCVIAKYVLSGVDQYVENPNMEGLIQGETAPETGKPVENEPSVCPELVNEDSLETWLGKGNTDEHCAVAVETNDGEISIIESVTGKSLASQNTPSPPLVRKLFDTVGAKPSPAASPARNNIKRRRIDSETSPFSTPNRTPSRQQSENLKGSHDFSLQRATSLPVSRKTLSNIPLVYGKEILIGRARMCDVRLVSSNPQSTNAISRKHAKLIIGPKEKQFKCSIIDLKSSNGVFVNYRRIQPGKPHQLNPKDVVIFGGGGKTQIGSTKRFRSEFRYVVEPIELVDLTC